MLVISTQQGAPRLVRWTKPLRESVLFARARCTGTKRPFAIRFEQTANGVWSACGTIRITERQLSNSAFSSNRIVSSNLSPNYPGCPHCGADSRKQLAGISFLRCFCGELACSSGIIGAETLCPWCNRAGTLVSYDPLPVAWNGKIASSENLISCFRWGWTPKRAASSATVASLRNAASATLALKAGSALPPNR